MHQGIASHANYRSRGCIVLSEIFSRAFAVPSVKT
jgi:hypothetical protein